MINALYPLWAHLPLGNLKNSFPKYSLEKNTSFASVHPMGTKRGPLCSWKSHPPGQCCIFPGQCCPAKPLTEWHQYVWILNTKHDPHSQHKAQPVPCSPCCLALSVANLLLTGAFWKPGHLFFYVGSEKCPSFQPPRELECISCQRWGMKSLYSSRRIWGWLMHGKTLPVQPLIFWSDLRQARQATNPIWSFGHMPREAQLSYLFCSPLATHVRWCPCAKHLALNDRPLGCYDAFTIVWRGVLSFYEVITNTQQTRF